MHARRWLDLGALFVLASLLGLVVTGAVHDRGMAVDDAYITFRYADNLQQGLGLRWNADSPPCEGYTNFTYVLGLAALRALGLAPLDGALLLANLSLVGIVALAWSATRGAGRWRALALAPIVLLFATDTLQVHASRGLETCLFALLATLTVTAQARLAAANTTRRRHAVAAAAAATLLFLTRPDGVLLASCGFVAVAWLVRGERQRWRHLLLAVAVWLAAGLVYAAFKLAVFGYLLPNAFYMKSGGGRFQGLDETLAFVRAFPLPLALLLLAAAASPAWWRPRTRPLGQHDAFAFLATVVTVAWLAYSAKIVHEIGYAFRFAWPLLPLVLLAACRSLSSIGARLEACRLGRAWPIAPVALLLALSAALPQQRTLLAQLRRPPPQDPYTSMFLRLGEAIRDTGIAPQLTLYCTHAGATPWAAGAHHVDRAGLVDDGYCLRTPLEERARYEANLRLDVISWHLFPAAPGATDFDGDDRASSSSYLRQWCLGLDPGMDTGLRKALEGRDLGDRTRDLYTEMLFLREIATFVGEMRTGQRRWRTFVYVAKTSPHHDRLVQHLSRRVDIPAANVDFDGWPQ